MAQERVTAPIIVSGLPRTGTTLLSNLLESRSSEPVAAGVGGRRGGPATHPVEPQGRPRIAESVKDSGQLSKLAPSVQAMHPMAATLPTECVTLLGGEFKSIHFETQGTFDTYGTWFEACGHGAGL